jgi:hypothetical protein
MRMNQASKRNCINVAVVSFLIAIVGSSIGWAADKPKKEFTWEDYQQALLEEILVTQIQDFRIPDVKITLDLPQNLDKPILVLAMASFMEKAFQDLQPYLRIENQVEKKRYTIPVEKESAEQVVEVPLKDLPAGKNTLILSFEWRQSNYQCGGSGCGYGVYAVFFKDFPPPVEESEEESKKESEEESELEWPDYQKPLDLNVWIRQNECAPPDIATIKVELPADFLQNVAKRTVTIELESNSDDSKGKELGFDLLKVYLNVNGVKYSIPVNDYPAAQVQQISISSKDLRSGQNTLQASFEWTEEDWCCNNYGCGYTIKKLSFE